MYIIISARYVLCAMVHSQFIVPSRISISIHIHPWISIATIYLQWARLRKNMLYEFSSSNVSWRAWSSDSSSLAFLEFSVATHCCNWASPVNSDGSARFSRLDARSTSSGCSWSTAVRPRCNLRSFPAHHHMAHDKYRDISIDWRW